MFFYSKYPICLQLLLVLFITIFSGCGGGGGGVPATATGRFVDAPVQGLSYVSGSQSGVTGVNGEFVYEIGKPVRFKVGDIIIGEAPAASILTPIDLIKANGATNVDANHPDVLRMVRFLLTAGSLTASGIRIDDTVKAAAAGKSINFSSDSSIITVLGQIAPGRTIPSNVDAAIHFAGSLFTMFAGDYQATLSGTYDGTLSLTVKNTGEISGTLTLKNGNAITVAGSIYSDGSFALNSVSGSSVALSVSGRIATSWNIDGSWIAGNGSGQVTGSRTIPPSYPCPVPSDRRNGGSITIPVPPSINVIVPSMPSTAAISIAIPGAIPANSTIGAMEATIILPAGLSLVNDGTSSGGYLVKLASSQSPDTGVTLASYSAPTASTPGKIKFQVYQPAGFSSYEYVSVQLNFSSASVPLAADFNVTGISISDLNGKVISVTNSASTVVLSKRITKATPLLRPSVPDGVVDPANSSGIPAFSDFIITSQAAMGMIALAPQQLIHVDVAPLINGLAVPDGKIDIGDALLILRRVKGLGSW